MLAAIVAASVAACSLTPAATPSLSATPAPASPSPTTLVSSAPPAATPSPSQSPLAWSVVDATGPNAREDHTWTLDRDGGTAFLFGGRSNGRALGDLWAFDLRRDAWTELNPPGEAPAARFGHEAAWVDGIGLVVFAGQAGASFFNDLWAFDPTDGAWRALPSSGDVPIPRYGTCAAVGPDGRLWISHGFTSDGARFADTRAYDFDDGSWTDATPEGSRPVERCLHGCWWTDDGTFTLYAGQTTGVTALGDRWLLDGDVWTAVEGVLPPDRNLYARVRIGAATLIVGGQALDGSFLGDAWILSDGSSDATPLDVDGAPPRAGAELVHDTADGRVLLFGGRDATGEHADMWALTGLDGADR